MTNTRPADFPSDAEIDSWAPLNTLAALLDAFVGSDEWDEHDIRERCEHDAELVRMGAEDCAAGMHFVPEQYFVPGTAAYRAYCAGYYTERLKVTA